MGIKIQRVRKRFTNRVTSTIKGIRTRSQVHAGFPAAPGSGPGGQMPYADGTADDSKSRYMQLHNTIIRALLVVPVSYEPSKLLRRSKDAVAIITGADLVVVKMSKTASDGGSNARMDATAAMGAAASNFSAADVAQATVLAQHDLNKMITCQAIGNRLELEFIVTGSARFKVSAAALGFSSSGNLDAADSRPHSQASRTDSALYDEAVAATTHTGSSKSRSRLSQQSQAGTAPLQGAMPQPASTMHTHHADTAANMPSGVAAGDRSQGAEGTEGDSSSDRGTQTPRSVSADLPAAVPRHLVRDTSRASAPGDLAPNSSRFAAAAAELARGSPDITNTKSSVHWSPQPRSYSGGGVGGSSSGGSTSAPIMQNLDRSSSYVKSFKSSVASHVEDASRSVSSSISSFKLVKTDEGEYWVCVESFTLQFRDALMCELAAELLQSGRASMRVAFDWLKQGWPFSPEFAVTHITELSGSRTGPEALVSGPVGWSTDLQLPDSWVDTLCSAELPQEQPLLHHLEVPGGPAGFKVHLATPAGLAAATLVPELLALLAEHPHTKGQLLAVPVSLNAQQAAGVKTTAQDDRQQSSDNQTPLADNGNASQQGGTNQHEVRAGLHAAADQQQQASAVQCQHQEEEMGQQHSRLQSPSVAYTQQDRQHQQRLQMASHDIIEDSCSMSSNSDHDLVCYQSITNSPGAANTGSSCSDISMSEATDLHRPLVPPASSSGPAAVGGGSGAGGSAILEFAAVPGKAGSMSTSRMRKIVSIPSRSYGAAKGLLKRVVTSKDSQLSSRSMRGYMLSRAGSPLVGHSVPNPGSDSRTVGTSRAFRRSKSQPEGLASYAAAVAGDAGRPVLHQASHNVFDSADSDGEASHGTFGMKRKFGSSGDLVALQHASAAGFSKQQSRLLQFQRERYLSGRSLGSSSVHSGSSTSTGPQQYGVLDHQQQHPQLLDEVYAVLHVQLIQGSDDDTSTAVRSVSALYTANSPFAAAATQAGPATDAAAGTAVVHGSQGQQDALSAPSSSLVVLGSNRSGRGKQLSLQEQQVLSAAGLVAAVLCALALLFLHTAVGPLLILFAVILNIACMVASTQPAWVRLVSRKLLQQLHRLPQTAHLHTAKPNSSRPLSGPGNGLATQLPAASGTSTPATTAAGPAATVPGRKGTFPALRLRLLGASFVREPMGMLQEQISAFRAMQERAASGALSQGTTAADEDGEQLQDSVPGHLMAGEAVDSDAIWLVSSPEPAWMTPDWRTRIFAARPTIEERRKLATYIHTWRVQYAADRLLKQQPPNFAWFQKQLQLKPLLVTPQGHVVILLKMASLVQTSRNIAAAGLTANDLTAYCGFIWSFMFEKLAPGAHPSGRLILISDMRDVKLGQAVGEGQVGGRALGAVCNAWPERLVRCLVLGTPSWFNMLYRMVRPHLSPSTGAKIQVCDSNEAKAELARCLGPEWVPQEYGGSCNLHLDEYPAQKQLLEYVQVLA